MSPVAEPFDNAACFHGGELFDLLQALVVVEVVSLDESACVTGSRLSREIMHWCIGMAGPRSNMMMMMPFI